MAGENVTERIVRKVFSESLDLVVHVDRDDIPSGADGRSAARSWRSPRSCRRSSADQTFEPIFVREGLGPAAGVDRRAAARARSSVSTAPCPTACAARARSSDRTVRSREARSPRSRSACSARCSPARSGRLLPRRRTRAPSRRRAAPSGAALWLQQAGAGVSPHAVRARRRSAAGFVALVLVTALTGLARSSRWCPAVAVALAASRVLRPPARRCACARCTRRGPTGCATSSRRSRPGRSLTQAVDSAGATRSAAAARRVRTLPGTRAGARDRRRRSSREGGARRSDERPGARGADPRAGARRRDRPRRSSTTSSTRPRKDLKLLDELETEGLEMRINARAVVVLPWLVLVALTARAGAFRDFYQSGGGVLTLLVGAGALTAIGVVVLGRLGREPDRAACLSEQPERRVNRSGCARRGRRRHRSRRRCAALIVPPTHAGSRPGPSVRRRRRALRSGSAPDALVAVAGVDSRRRVDASVRPAAARARARRSGAPARRGDDSWHGCCGKRVIADRTPDEYRVRQLGDGAGGRVVTGGSRPVLARDRRRRRSSGRALRASSSASHPLAAPARARGRRARPARIRLELYTVNQLLAMHVRTGAGPMQAVQRLVDRGRRRRGRGARRDARAAIRQRHGRSRRVPARGRSSRRSRARRRTYQLFAAGARARASISLSRLLALSEDIRDACRRAAAQGRGPAARRDARADDRDPRPDHVAVHRRAAALDRARSPVTVPTLQ